MQKKLTADAVALWTVRLLVIGLPFAMAQSLDAAITTTSHPLVLEIGLWASWAVLLLSTLVAHPVSLTAMRVLGAGAIALALWANATKASPIAVTWAIALFIATCLSQVGTWAINGLSYPNERRFLLRPPTALYFGPLLIAVAIIGAVPVLALHFWDTNMVASIAILVIGLPIAWFVLMALHKLSRRWVVFVPAGLVVHDPMSLVDPVLFTKSVIERFAPAPADTDALDLTQRAAGLAIELDLTEKVPMVLVKPMQAAEAGSSARLMITPTRAGAVLTEAKSRKLPVSN